jgi:WD40 repeat protein
MQQPGFTPNPIASLAYTPDGRHLALGLVAHRLVVCEAETGKVVADVSGTEVSELAFSPDGQRLATAGRRNPTVRVWDWRAGKELRQFTGHRSDVTTLAFSLDGRRLVSGADDTTALIWDVRDVRPGDK